LGKERSETGFDVAAKRIHELLMKCLDNIASSNEFKDRDLKLEAVVSDRFSYNSFKIKKTFLIIF
jgi:hypothetical protein